MKEQSLLATREFNRVSYQPKPSSSKNGIVTAPTSSSARHSVSIKEKPRKEKISCLVTIVSNLTPGNEKVRAVISSNPHLRAAIELSEQFRR